LGAVAGGQDPAKERTDIAGAITVAALAERFLEEHARPKRKNQTASSYEATLRAYVLPRFGNRAAERFTVAEVAQVHHAMKVRPYQANRMLAIVSSMYGFGEQRGLVAKGTNPAEGIERFRESRRERFLNGDEISRLGDALRLAETVGLPWQTRGQHTSKKHVAKEENQRTVFAPEVTLAFRLLLLTGARLREILNLEWRHVDLERGLLLLPDSKTGRKTIVLSAAALLLLQACERAGTFVIPGISGNKARSDLKKPWLAIQRYAELEGVRIHDLRHTFASIGAGASLGLPIVGKLLGHTQPATTARYAHLDADPLRRASNLIGDRLTAALASRDPSS
jgi:integrase